MSKFITETVTYVHHWNDSLFTIKATRGDSLRFRNGGICHDWYHG